MTDEQFDDFVDSCYKNLETKQRLMYETYRIGTFSDYWFDQELSVLQFKNSNKVELEFEIVCIGSWAHKNETWMWSWANPSMTNECREDSGRIKALKTKTGVEIFEMEGLNCSEEMAYELVAMSVSQLDAIGMYKIPGEKSHLFVALINATFVFTEDMI